MPTDLSSIVVVEVSPKGKAIGYVRSTAVLRTFLALGAPWSALYLTVAIPEFIRDGVYGLVAKHPLLGVWDERRGGRCSSGAGCASRTRCHPATDRPRTPRGPARLARLALPLLVHMLTTRRRIATSARK